MSRFVDTIIFCSGILFGIIIDHMIKSSHDIPKNYKQGYSSGYKRAKLIYECDHDRIECEILKDTL